MLQAKFSMDVEQVRFLNSYKTYGFNDKSSMLRAAIDYYGIVKSYMKEMK